MNETARLGLSRILATTVPNADEVATALLKEFGSAGALLTAFDGRLGRTAPPAAVEHLRAIKSWVREALCARAAEQPVLDANEAVLNYLRLDLSAARIEQFRVLYLDYRSMLLEDRVIGIGDVSAVTVSIREALHRALDLGAVSVLLVHNHPGGSLKPSNHDIEFTRRFVQGARALDVRVLDHVIVAPSGCTSFRTLNLM
ncbi:RadC family protein [Sphingomonas sp. ac-8]|uniref:JAB domain-containing protein n=1 Tax=Sphingomonas sp. ac-8 TaxID=3242977 RepID=UPI003A804C7E